MTAVVRVIEGTSVGQMVPLSSIVCRIGSDTECDLVVPGEEPLAVVVRSKRDERLVYNRSESAIAVGRKSVMPGQSVRWREGQPLRLSYGTLLEWAASTVEPPPQQSVSEASGENMADLLETRPAHLFVDVDAAAEAEETAGSRLRVVAGLMVLFAIYLFGSDDGGRLNRSALALHSVVERLVEKMPDSDPRLRYVRVMVQSGRSYELRGAAELAREQYIGVRKLLNQPRTASDPMAKNPAVTQLEKDTRKFVVGRIDKLKV